MNKKAIGLTLALLSALLILPVAASAHQWHSSQTGGFTVAGGSLATTTTVGTSLNCSSMSGGGKYTTTTGGTLTLTFHGCKLGLLNCTSAGQPAGTIKTDPAALPFDNIMIANNQPGILITPSAATTEITPGTATYPGAKRLMWEFLCGGVATKVFGNGVIGTITSPACGVASSTTTLSFTSGLEGHQTHQTWTGNMYDLEATLPGSNLHTTTSIDATATITHPQAKTATCTNT